LKFIIQKSGYKITEYNRILFIDIFIIIIRGNKFSKHEPKLDETKKEKHEPIANWFHYKKKVHPRERLCSKMKYYFFAIAVNVISMTGPVYDGI
jgi:hypothetical protein